MEDLPDQVGAHLVLLHYEVEYLVATNVGVLAQYLVILEDFHLKLVHVSVACLEGVVAHDQEG